MKQQNSVITVSALFNQHMFPAPWHFVSGILLSCALCPKSTFDLYFKPKNSQYLTWILSWQSKLSEKEGSTTRFLHDRVKEHLTNDNSSVKKHLIMCHHNTQNIEAKIITHENDPANLRLCEALFIRKHKPFGLAIYILACLRFAKIQKRWLDQTLLMCRRSVPKGTIRYI